MAEELIDQFWVEAEDGERFEVLAFRPAPVVFTGLAGRTTVAKGNPRHWRYVVADGRALRCTGVDELVFADGRVVTRLRE